MRQKTCFSVVEMRSENVAFVSENEGSDLGIPWPNGPPSSDCPVVWHADGPPSSDCPVGWHTDDAPRRHRVRDRYLPKTRECVSPFPQGLFMPPKTRPRVFPEAKVAFRVDETLVWHTRPDPADPADWCHQVPLRPSLPHAPGVRMTAVTTNSLK